MERARRKHSNSQAVSLKFCLDVNTFIKGAILHAVETGTAIQIQNIGESYIHRPLLSRLKAYVDCPYKTCNKNKRKWQLQAMGLTL